MSLDGHLRISCLSLLHVYSCVEMNVVVSVVSLLCFRRKLRFDITVEMTLKQLSPSRLQLQLCRLLSGPATKVRVLDYSCSSVANWFLHSVVPCFPAGSAVIGLLPSNWMTKKFSDSRKLRKNLRENTDSCLLSQTTRIAQKYYDQNSVRNFYCFTWNYVYSNFATFSPSCS